MRYEEQVKVVEKTSITPKLQMTVSLSLNKKKYYLDVFYGTMSLQRYFPNTLGGKKELELTKELFNTEEKIKKYFNLGE
jgi:hypothetical protein